MNPGNGYQNKSNFKKLKTKHEQLNEMEPYEGYRAENLHAEIFLKVMWVLDRSRD